MEFKADIFTLKNYDKIKELLDKNVEESSPMPWDLDVSVFSFIGQHTFWMEDDGEYVGFAVVRMVRHPHFNKITACVDVLYVDPAYRGMQSIKFIKWMEMYLRNIGAEGIFQGSTSKKDISPLLERLGYKQVEIVHFKEL